MNPSLDPYTDPSVDPSVDLCLDPSVCGSFFTVWILFTVYMIRKFFEH